MQGQLEELSESPSQIEGWACGLWQRARLACPGPRVVSSGQRAQTSVPGTRLVTMLCRNSFSLASLAMLLGSLCMLSEFSPKCLSRRVSLLQGLCCHRRRWLRTSCFSCCLCSSDSYFSRPFSGCDLNEHMGLRAGAFSCQAGPPTFPKARGDPEVSGTKDGAITGQENTAHGPCRPFPGPYTPHSV